MRFVILSAIWESCVLKLTHWGRVTHICVGKLTIIGSDNDLSPERRQAIIWTNVGILIIGPLGTNFSEILIEIQTFSLKKMRLKMSSEKCCSFRLGLNVLTTNQRQRNVFSDMLDWISQLGMKSGLCTIQQSETGYPMTQVLIWLMFCSFLFHNLERIRSTGFYAAWCMERVSC